MPTLARRFSVRSCGRRLKFISADAAEARSSSPSWPRLSAKLEGRRWPWVVVDESPLDQCSWRPFVRALARHARGVRRRAGRLANLVEV
eukprot:1705226-Pyramimonas_sp.AAC.1